MAVEIEVGEAGAFHVAEARDDFIAQHAGGFVGVDDWEGFEIREKFADGELPEVVQGFAFDVEEGGFDFESGTEAVGAFGVGAVAAEEDADVHLVGAGFLPFEEAADAIPFTVAIGFFGIGVVAFDEPLAVFLGVVFEGEVEVDMTGFGALDEVLLAFGVGVAGEGFDQSFVDAEGFIGHGLGEVEREGASETPAGGAGSDGVVKGEEAGGGGGQFEVAVGAVPGGAERFEIQDLRFEIGEGDGDGAFAEMEGDFESFDEAGFVGGGELDAVLDDLDLGGEFLFEGLGFVGADDFAEQEDAGVTLALKEGEEVGGVGVGRDGNGEGDEGGGVGVVVEEVVLDGVGGVGLDGALAAGAGGFGEPGEEHFEVVVQLGDGADGGTGGADVVDLLDGDGGGDAVDGVDLWFVHALKKLTRVGGEGFDVAALAFGVDGVEGEGGFAGAGGAGDDVELVEGDVEVEAFEVVLMDAADLDDVGGWAGL